MNRRHFVREFGGIAIITSLAGCGAQLSAEDIPVEEVKDRSTTISCEDYISEEYEKHQYLHFEEMSPYHWSDAADDGVKNDPNQYYFKITGKCAENLAASDYDLGENLENAGIIHAELNGDPISSRIGSSPNSDDLFEIWGRKSGTETIELDLALDIIFVTVPSIKIHELEYLGERAEE